MDRTTPLNRLLPPSRVVVQVLLDPVDGVTVVTLTRPQVFLATTSLGHFAFANRAAPVAAASVPRIGVPESGLAVAGAGQALIYAAANEIRTVTDEATSGVTSRPSKPAT